MVLNVGVLVQGAPNSEQLSGWKYYTECQPGSHALPYNGTYLTESVYKHSRADLGDLRVVDHQNNFVPYYLVGYDMYAENAVQKEYSETIVHYHFENHNTVSDFHIDSAPHRDVLVNKLVLDLASESFLFNVQLYGSYDNLNWEYITSDQVYKADHHISAVIELPRPAKYTCYRIVLQDNIRRIPITRIQPQYSENLEIRKEYTRTTPLRCKVVSQNGESQVTIYNPDRLMLRSLHLKAAGNFHRDYTLAGIANHENLSLATGTIYQIDIGADRADLVSVEVPPLDRRFTAYQLTIKDHDDRPLSITGIEATYSVHKLVFPQQNQGCRLWYGNPQAPPPNYDLERYKDRIDKANINSFTLGKEQVQPVAAPPPPSSIPKTLFNVLIVLTALILVVFIASRL